MGKEIELDEEQIKRMTKTEFSIHHGLSVQSYMSSKLRKELVNKTSFTGYDQYRFSLLLEEIKRYKKDKYSFLAEFNIGEVYYSRLASKAGKKLKTLYNNQLSVDSIGEKELNKRLTKAIKKIKKNRKYIHIKNGVMTFHNMTNYEIQARLPL